MDAMKERCIRICGSQREQCFIDNRNQIACIADVVLNKVTSIKGMLELAQLEDSCDKIHDYHIKIARSLNGLHDWVIFLELANDLRQMSLLLDQHDREGSRKDLRCPVPEFYRRYMDLGVEIEGESTRVELTDFSRQGISFRSPFAMAIESRLNCCLNSARIATKRVMFRVLVKHCSAVDKGYLVGAEIKEISDMPAFNFFRNIYDFIGELGMPDDVRSKPRTGAGEG